MIRAGLTAALAFAFCASLIALACAPQPARPPASPYLMRANAATAMANLTATATAQTPVPAAPSAVPEPTTEADAAAAAPG